MVNFAFATCKACDWAHACQDIAEARSAAAIHAELCGDVLIIVQSQEVVSA